MPQKIVKFSGINRKVNEFQGSGACEELINLRPDITGVHRVVKQKDQIWKGAYWGKVYEHSFGDVHNLIGVRTNGTLDIIHSQSATPFCTEFNSGDVELTFAGNVLVAYSADEKKQLVYKYNKDSLSYETYEFVPKPIIKSHIELSTEARYSVTADDGSLAAVNSALAMASSGFYSENPNGSCGTIIVGCTYELDDGNEIWSTAFVTSTFNEEPTYSAESRKVTVIGRKQAKLILRLGEAEAKNCKRINIYASRPTYRYEFKSTTQSGTTVLTPYRKSAEDCGLGGQLMFYQGYVIPNKEEVSFTLKLGHDLAGEKTMEVTNGCIERIGPSTSYNNRFHFYRFSNNHVIQQPTVSKPAGARETADTWIAYVKFDKEWKGIQIGYKFKANTEQDFIYPMAGIKQLAFVKLTGDYLTPYNDMFYVDMMDSSAYNYSCAFDVTPEIVSASDFYKIIKNAGQLWGQDELDRIVKWKEEPNSISVSAQYNPFVFPVEHSYSFSGEIKDIATSYLPISATQVGQYPLTVFTSNGIFAMEQGSGTVLYSNIIPLQPLVSDNKAVTTPYGTFFTSSKILYMLSGRDTANMSYVLNGELETNLRELDAYKILCCGKKGAFYDFSPLLSSKDFEEYITGATLTYDQLNNELLISSNDPDSTYSYVLNLDTKAYHKVGKKYVSVQNGARYILEQTGNVKNIVDMHTEEKGVQPILLQSRPLSLEAFHTHIQRLILMADAKLTDNQNLSISVFGSDNLYDWKCIISAQKHNTVLRQIRTNKAPKSYRDYIIIISGTVDTDTDISDLIADYSVVTRRLG